MSVSLLSTSSSLSRLSTLTWCRLGCGVRGVRTRAGSVRWTPSSAAEVAAETRNKIMQDGKNAHTDPDAPLSKNDQILPNVRNRNPVNLERLGIGHKPSGFYFEQKERSYWNKLDLTISSGHTTARVTHWTGRVLCEVSTKEWSIRKYLYNYTDAAAVEAVAAVLGQRCIEAGLAEVYLKVDEEDMKKERMRSFVQAVKDSGLILGERPQYIQFHPHAQLHGREKKRAKSWEITEEDAVRRGDKSEEK